MAFFQSFCYHEIFIVRFTDASTAGKTTRKNKPVSSAQAVVYHVLSPMTKQNKEVCKTITKVKQCRLLHVAFEYNVWNFLIVFSHAQSCTPLAFSSPDQAEEWGYRTPKANFMRWGGVGQFCGADVKNRYYRGKLLVFQSRFDVESLFSSNLAISPGNCLKTYQWLFRITTNDMR